MIWYLGRVLERGPAAEGRRLPPDAISSYQDRLTIPAGYAVIGNGILVSHSMSRTNILTSFQTDFLKQFGKTSLTESFFLTSGTALSAFFLHHRFSEDLDFFTEQPDQVPRVLSILETIAQKIGAKVEVRRQFKTFWTFFCMVKEMRVSNVTAQDSPYRLQQTISQKELGIFTDNALDIACNKLSALFDRSEAKDFVDIFFIDLELFSFTELLQYAKQKHIGLDDYWLAVSLLKVEDLGPLPRMVRPVDMGELKSFFLRQARDL